MKSTIRAFALLFAATATPAVAAQPAPQPASTPQPEAPVQHTPAVNSFVPYDAAAEARKTQLQSVEHRVPARLSLCPPPNRWTVRDGCQK